MFSKENRRFTALLIAAVLVIGFTMGGAVNLINHDHSSNVYILTAFSAMVLGQIYLMMRNEQSAQIAKRERKQQTAEVVGAVKEVQSENVKTAIETVAKEVKEAKERPAAGQEQMPKTPAELEMMLQRFSRGICDDLIVRYTNDAAHAAAEAAALKAAEVNRTLMQESARIAVEATMTKLREAGMLK